MRDPFADRPDLTPIVEQIRELAARAPDLVVSVALREPRKTGRHASGAGYISRKVSRGYVTYKPRVIVDGVVHWGDGVGVKVGVREAEAKAQAQQNLKRLLADIAQDKVVPTEVRQLTVGEVLTKWLAAIDGSDRSPNTKAKYRLHVERDDCEAKFWLDPLCLARSVAISARELRQIESIVSDNREQLLRSWHEYFDR